MKRLPRALAIAASALIIAPGFAGADPLAAAKSASSDGPLYAYDMTYETSELKAAGSVDPSQPEGNRIIVSTPAKTDWPDGFEDELAEMDKQTDGQIWCNEFADLIPDDAELVSETDMLATYTFTPKGEDKDDEKVMKHLVGTATIDKINPAITAFSMTAPKPFKPVFVAKIKTFNMAVTCKRAPDGRTYAQDLQMKVAGSAAMQSFEEITNRTITALRPVTGE